MIILDRITALAAIALFTAATAMPTQSVQAAVGTDELPSVTLRYSGTDLDTPQGVAGLYRRIRVAAATVCRRFDDAPLAEKQIWDICFNRAVAQAVLGVHNDNLSAYHWRQIRGLKWPWMQAPTSLAETSLAER
jgi:UrcA family protein